MSWGEALRLIRVLAADPSSATGAALADWEHPFSREALILADLFDVQAMSKSKRKPPPWPRPWVKRRHQWGNRRMSVAELKRLLAKNREP